MIFSSLRCLLLLTLVLWPCSDTFCDDAPQKNSVNFSYDKIQYTEAERNWLNQKHVVRARVGANPPLHFFNGKNRGLCVDYFNLIAEIIGFQVEYVNGIPWNDALEKIKAQETIDLLLTAKNIKERQPFMGFSNDYLLMPWVIFSRTNSKFISSIDDLLDRTVAVEKSFVMQRKLMTEFPSIKLLMKNNSVDALQAVASGEADAYIGNLGTSTYLINKHNLANLKVACPVKFGTHDQAFAVRKDWPELVSILNKAIMAIPQRELSRLRTKWFNVNFDYGISKIIFFKWLFIIIVVSAISLLFFVYKNRKLRVEVDKRKKAEERFELAMSAAQDGLYDWDLVNNTIYYSPAWKRMLGYKNDELPNDFSVWEKLTESEDAKRSWKMQQKMVNKKIDRFEMEFKMKHKEGHWVDILSRAKAFFNEKGKAIRMVGTHVDISDKKKILIEKEQLETKLRQAQKMESIGTLAGGIAHDFNNILSSIIGFTELALDEAGKGTNIEDDLQEVQAAGMRAKDLVKQILTFARQSDEAVKPIQVNVIAKEVLNFIKSSIPTTIQINDKIESDSFILGSPTQLHQVLMNLCTNAAQAMEEKGGILEVMVNDTPIDKMTIPALKAGEYIEIKVTDTGMGISPQHIHTVFEPYFTTKPMGEGTGMGLAVVHGIVENHGGQIRVDSVVGKGTCFTIYLPITKKRKVYTYSEKEDLPLGNENILFVDDEAPIAKMGSKALEQLGYFVTTRTSSIEALALFKLKPHSFDLVISDMTMPNMTGDILAGELMKIRPDIPVVLCTGYSKKLSEENAAAIDIKAFLYKPIVKADLAKTVRKVLDEAKHF